MLSDMRCDVKFLRQKWYETIDYGEGPKEPLDMNIFTKHCHRLMNKDIVELRKLNAQFPFDSRVTDFSLSVLSSETVYGKTLHYRMMPGGPLDDANWQEFREKAGIKDSSLWDVLEGDDLDGDPGTISADEMGSFENAVDFFDAAV